MHKKVGVLRSLSYIGALAVSSLLFAETAQKIEFVIIIPTYNHEQWIAEALQSACFQKTTHPYEVIVINDGSTDKTGTVIEEFVRKHNLGSKVTIVHNKKNKGISSNWFTTIHTLPDHKIIVNLDGDDKLAHNEVLLALEKYYADPDIWLTYGSFIAFPEFKILKKCTGELPESFFKERKIRQHRFVATHLRTFKAGLFKKVKKNDFMYRGKFITAAADVAFMIPMLDMCCPKDSTGKKHAMYVPEILYLHRHNNPESISNKKGNLQAKIARFILSKKPYPPVETL